MLNKNEIFPKKKEECLEIKAHIEQSYLYTEILGKLPVIPSPPPVQPIYHSQTSKRSLLSQNTMSHSPRKELVKPAHNLPAKSSERGKSLRTESSDNWLTQTQATSRGQTQRNIKSTLRERLLEKQAEIASTIQYNKEGFIRPSRELREYIGSISDQIMSLREETDLGTIIEPESDLRDLNTSRNKTQSRKTTLSQHNKEESRKAREFYPFREGDITSQQASFLQNRTGQPTNFGSADFIE